MKEGKNNRGKLILVISAILFLPMLYPQTISKAQNKIANVEGDTVSRRVNIINAEKNQKLDSALKEASILPAMTNTLTALRTRRKRADIRVKVVKPTIVLRYNGEIFEAEDIETYKGYLIVNLDSFLSPPDTVRISICDADTCRDNPAPVAPIKKRSWLKRMFGRK